jgi:DNA-binding NarL/FixJ family response regulator
VHALATGDLDRAETSFSQALHGLPRPTAIATQVQGLAVVAAARGQADRAVRLASGAQALHDVGGTSPEPVWQERVDHALDLARAALGTEATERARAEGMSVPVADLVTYALTGDWIASAEPSPLSEREHQVACLVAEGLTNRQIAAKVHVAERTVATYLEQIRHKLDLQTRIEVALWATRETNQNGSGT